MTMEINRESARFVPRVDRAVDHDPVPNPTREALKLHMPGDPEQTAEEIKNVSPEGRPGDPVAGPGELSGFMILAFCLLVLAAVGTAVGLGWIEGLVVLAIGSLALLANPVIIATFQRVKDRQEVLRERRKGSIIRGDESDDSNRV